MCFPIIKYSKPRPTPPKHIQRKAVIPVLKKGKGVPIILPDSPRAITEPPPVHITPDVHHRIHTQIEDHVLITVRVR